jgi:hypothetical protein
VRLYEDYPDAIRTFTHDGYSPLHLNIYGDNDKLDDPLSDSVNVMRFLIRHYPAAVKIRKIFDDANNPIDANVPIWRRVTTTPYQYAVKQGVPAYIRRLMLRACPEAGPNVLRRLNYDERRMAMFIGLSAVVDTKEGDDVSKFVISLQELVYFGEGMPLFKHVVSFL